MSEIIKDTYEILEKIGEGGMGVVYKGYQVSLKRLVAIKFLSGDILNNRILITRFKREALASVKISHPNVVKIIDLDSENNQYFLVMEYVKGGSLENLLERRGHLAEKDAIIILLQVVSALKIAHKLGIIHRDLKPSNILFTEDNMAKLADFGIAHFNEMTQLTQTGSIIGTPQYMSPEQAAGKKIDYSTDIYSLGVIFFEMLTGFLPFEAQNPVLYIQKHIYAKPPSPRDFNPKISKYIEEVVLKMLAKSPIDRFKSMEHLEKTLKNYLKTKGEDV